MSIPAGHVGNLTPEEELKLKEFWALVFNTFGIHDAKISSSGRQQPTPPSSIYSTESRRKKTSIFGGKSKSKAKPEDEDKYGESAELKQVLASQTPEELRTAFWAMIKCDHPDALLLRFLRARKWDINRALAMLVSTGYWRVAQMHIDDDIMLSGEEGAAIEEQGTDPQAQREGRDFLAQLRMGKSIVHGRDRLGRPITIVRARLHKGGQQTEKSLERYTVYVTETARLTLKTPVETGCLIFDLTGFTLANMDYTPVKFLIKIFEANYPESLGVVLVHRAPWVFNAIWKVIRGWLDPVVASKINFTSNGKDLEEYIPRSQMLKELGGDDPWEYKYIDPIPGENHKMADRDGRARLLDEREKIVQDYQRATVDWIHSHGDESDAIARTRDRLKDSLNTNYWQLDPYLRARSLWDREGMIRGDGTTEFFPTTNSPEKIAQLKTTFGGNGGGNGGSTGGGIGGGIGGSGSDGGFVNGASGVNGVNGTSRGHYDDKRGYAAGAVNGSLVAARRSTDTIDVWYDAVGSHRELLNARSAEA